VILVLLILILILVGVAVAFSRLSERMARLENAVRDQQIYLAEQHRRAVSVALARSSTGPLEPESAPPPLPPQPMSEFPPPPSGVPPWSVPGATPPSGEASIPWMRPGATPPTSPTAPRAREPIRLKSFGNRTVEEVVSENVVAIVGGLLVVAGAVFFLSLAISRGWIGETGRVAIALGVGCLMVAAGRKLGPGRPNASRPPQLAVGSLSGVLCGAGIAVLFLGTVVGTRVYEVLGLAGLPLAIGVGALATAIAISWRSPDLAGFGIGGALLAPILVDAPGDTATLAFVVVALLASCVVIVAMGWPWLLAVTLAATAPQVAAWIGPVANHSLIGDLAVVAAWNAVIVSAAVAGELRQATGRLRASFASVSFVAAATAGALGADQVDDGGGRGLAWWLAAIAALHLVAATAAWAADPDPSRPVSEHHPTPVWAVLIGSAFMAMALAAAFDSALLVAGWAFEAVVLWWLAARTSDLRARLVGATLGALALGHVLIFDAPFTQFAFGSDDLAGSLLAVAAIAVAAGAGAWLQRNRPVVSSRMVLLSAVSAVWGAGIAVVTVITPRVDYASVIDVRAQLALMALWATTALILSALTALRRLPAEWTVSAVAIGILVPVWGLGAIQLNDSGEWSDVARWGVIVGAGAFGALAAGVAARTCSAVAASLAGAWLLIDSLRLGFELEWFADAVWAGSLHLAAASALATLTMLSAALLLRRRSPSRFASPWAAGEAAWRQASAVATVTLAAFLTIYVLSDGVVSALSGGPVRSDPEQDAQMALSLLWGAIGVAGFVLAGARRLPPGSTRWVRRASLGLLAISVLKVVLLDTRQLESTFRVLVFVGLGVLLLVGAWLDQRLRSRPVPLGD